MRRGGPFRVGHDAGRQRAGVFVECEAGAAIPLYRLVHLQLERVGGLNPAAREASRRPVLSAVWRVAPCRRSTGTPSGYALRSCGSAGAAQVPRRGRSMAV
jgi:hypothetical protein